jgi:hypothetical protein
MLGKIFSFGKKKKEAQAHTGAQGAEPQIARPASAAMPAPAPTSEKPQMLSEVDVAEVLDDLAEANLQKLNWRTSIVDLMKLLDMDSSLEERRALADELGYDGDKKDSAAMNIWLHKQVIKAFAENGGRIPADMLD